MEKSIRELQSKIELLSAIRPEDGAPPLSKEKIVQLINEKEEALNRVCYTYYPWLEIISTAIKGLLEVPNKRGLE